jgi:hypothetical protein
MVVPVGVVGHGMPVLHGVGLGGVGALVVVDPTWEPVITDAMDQANR